ncbi:hypothetical protein BC937DRAFT_90363 [Endogone sp. FLAS-F59071]|nr:hypothetical protein BC937DRAFT_90363 [Endogone sp. FLAS-F59071]|eukprot:RUS22109.1 hypothetical protein BC937DRAFT_90363 [Endogone sp. FLAS-F59071]
MTSSPTPITRRYSLPSASFRYFNTDKTKPTPGPVRVQPRHRQRHHERRPHPVSVSAEEALARRRHVYANGLLVKRVGSNRYSKFDEVSEY